MWGEGGEAGPAVHLSSLAIRDYRNLAQVEVELPPEGVVLVGDNGQGKTNFLEAAYYLQVFRALRGSRDVDLVRFGAAGFHLAATIDGGPSARELTVGFEREGRRKRVRADGVAVERASDAIGSLPAVVFSPSDVSLVTGEPAVRRRYLDVLLALTSRAYLGALQRYRAALAQRNAVLRDGARSGRVAESAVAIWEPALARDGAVLIAERERWTAEAGPRFGSLCAEAGEFDDAAFRYVGAVSGEGDVADRLLRALETRRPLDLRRGLTHVGPHRDNLLLTLGGRETRMTGSAGQQRTAAIVLRMLEAETYVGRVGRVPVFLLDDPFAELDAGRAERILRLVRSAGGGRMGQTLLAVPRASDIPSGFRGLPRATVSGGQVAIGPA